MASHLHLCQALSYSCHMNVLQTACICVMLIAHGKRALMPAVQTMFLFLACIGRRPPGVRVARYDASEAVAHNQGYVTIARFNALNTTDRPQVACPLAGAVPWLPVGWGVSAIPVPVHASFYPQEAPPRHAMPLWQPRGTGWPPAHRSCFFYVKADAYRRDTRGRNARGRDGWKQT